VRWLEPPAHPDTNQKLRIRYEKQAANYQGLVEFACALIVHHFCLFLG